MTFELCVVELELEKKRAIKLTEKYVTQVTEQETGRFIMYFSFATCSAIFSVC
jgi:hypothetical protein